jgi:hypothetical protein
LIHGALGWFLQELAAALVARHDQRIGRQNPESREKLVGGKVRAKGASAGSSGVRAGFLNS